MTAKPPPCALNHLHLWMIGSSAAFSAALAALIWARWSLIELTPNQSVAISDAIWMLTAIHSLVVMVFATLLHRQQRSTG